MLRWVDAILVQFRRLGREEKMQALLGYAKKLEAVPARLRGGDRRAIEVPECRRAWSDPDDERIVPLLAERRVLAARAD